MRIVVIISAFIALITGCTAHRSPSAVTAIVVPAGSFTVTATYSSTAVTTQTPAVSNSPTYTPTASNSPTHTPAVTATGTPGCFIVSFPDPNLEIIIRRVIGKPSEDIYNCDLARLEEIYQIETNIDVYDLSGLEYCTNLKKLYLCSFKGNTLASLGTLKQIYDLTINGDHQVLDITALSGLTTLEKLNLWDVDISGTINSISSLINLVVLYLDVVTMPNLSSLSALINLESLKVTATDLSDISVVSGMTRLEVLEIVAGRITSLSDLSGLNLRSFRFIHTAGNGTRSLISDLSPFAGMTNLENFSITGADITDLSPLSNCTALNEISITDTLITNLNGLSALTNLQHVSFRDNLNLNDISGLANSKSISSLTVYNSKVTDISVISDLPILGWIVLDYNMITDIHPVVLNAQNSSYSSNTTLFLLGNPLSGTALSEIELLRNTYGVSVYY